MTQAAVKTTEIEITNSTINFSPTQTQYINQGIAKGLADMQAGRTLSDPKAIEDDILRRFEEKKQAYLASLK